MQTSTITLDSVAVDAARKRFETVGIQRKGSFTFDQYLEYYAQECNSFGNLAKLTGRNKGSEYRTYLKFFAQLFPKWRTPKVRNKICLRKRHISLRNSQILSDNFARLNKLLRAQNLHIKLIPQLTKWRYKYNEHSMLVNSKRCRISYGTRLNQTDTRKTSSPWYTRTQVTKSALRGFDFFIVVQAIDTNPWHVYVIPIADLLQARDKEELVILIRYHEKTVDRGLKPLLDFPKYKNAWDLLK